MNVNDSQEDDDLQFCHSEAYQPPKTQRNTSEIQLERFDNLLKELGEQVKIPEVKKYRLSTLIISLESLISGNKACMKIQDEKPRKLKVAERIAGNANNVLQPRFSKTIKKTGRPRKAPLRKPTEEEIRNLLRYLLLQPSY